MKKLPSILSACNFACCLLLILLGLFHESLNISDITMFAGRFHVLFLHLPIGGMFALICIRLLKKTMQQEPYEHIFNLVLSNVVLVSLLSAITGLFIAASGDYSEEAVALHRKAGMTFSVLLYAFSVLRHYLGVMAETLLFTLLIFVLVFTGHQGGVITHGTEFFALNPDQTDETDTTDWNKKPVFESAIMPVMQKKCTSCHNEQKSKGGLRLTDTASWQNGGKSGALLIAGDVNNSLIINRLLLPMDDEHHMPPAEKPQLTEEEINLLRIWIESGASYTKTIQNYSENDSLMAIVSAMIFKTSRKEKQYTFVHAPKEVVSRLNNPYVSVKPVYAGSPALSASFFVASAYQTASLDALKTIGEQLVHLNLSGMPLGGKDFEIIASFRNLERLYLNNTAISDQDIKLLEKLQNLVYLSMQDCRVSPAVEILFSSIKPLQTVHIGSNEINEGILASWQKRFKGVNFVSGVKIHEAIPLSPPIFKNEEGILKTGDSIRLMHHIRGARILYTIDGSVPDTIKGIQYRKPFAIRQSAEIKAIAIKEGWVSSQPASFNAYEAGVEPKSVRMISRPALQYPGLGPATFTNRKLATISNTRDANWIGYRDEPCILEVEFEKPVAVQRVVLNFACHIPQYIFPPTRIRVYGGNNLHAMQLLGSKSLKPILPAEKEKVLSETAQLSLSGKAFRYFRIEADNLSKIPAWHPGKGEKGWLFMDEIFFYQ
jgi:hypothetical protein